MLASRIRAAALAVLVASGAAAILFAEGADAPAPAPGKKVNINTASAVEIAYLPRIGAKVADQIVERRKQKPFSRAEELMEVKGVGEKLFLSLKPYVAVSGPTTLTSKVKLSQSSSGRRASPPAAPEKPAPAVPVGKGR